MPKIVSSFKLVVGRRYLKAFSLIELMVVLTLFGLATTLVSASYLKFERGQRLKGAALQLVSDLRYVQNKATEQDKGAKNGIETICESTDTLGGWYLFADADPTSSLGNTSYLIGGDCITSPSEPNETLFYDSQQTQRTIKLPRDIRINRIFFAAGNFTQPVAVLFRPQKVGVTYHNGGATFPGFFMTDGKTLDNPMPGLPQSSQVTIELANSSEDFYWVVIQPSGEVNEVKP